MRQAALLLVLVLASCGQREDGAPAGRQSGEPVQTADLTGLYEARGEGGQSARMCMVANPSGTASFGVVTDVRDRGNCGGAGEAVRQGDVLRLTMAGDEECVIEARVEGTRVTLPPNLASGCAYYCGPDATLAGKTFEKTGGTAEDAMRATDLAGDPLCG